MKRSMAYFMTHLFIHSHILFVSTYPNDLKKIKESTIKITSSENRQLCTINIFDPSWDNQWYLNGSGIIPTDSNVLHAWQKCLNGTGITIAVVDDGLFDHQDLTIDRTLDDDIRPSVPSTKTHGTRVAGVIAAKRNNNCGVGIAFEATLADLRILTGSIEPDSDVAAILISSLDKIDIYSNSYTNPTIPVGLYPIGEAVLNSLKRGTTEGRHGRGSIYVWSTGNGGDLRIPFGCAHEGLNNNPYVIPVAGVRYNYNKLSSGDSCSSIMVAAFSRENTDTDKQIVTSHNSNECTGSFGRNSAAVPMVSGAIALALQANPDLGYRDIMHLLVLSSNSSLPFQPNDFVLNGVGRKVSITFGFGLLDIGKLVDMAELWTNVNALSVCSFSSNLSCRLSSNRTENVTFESCRITALEHVEVYFKVDSARSGQLKLDLLSPSGTSSNIIPGRLLDNRMELNMTVISVHFWGELPFGKWTLMASDISGDNTRLLNGTMVQMRLTFYGTNDVSFSSTSTTTSTFNSGSSSTMPLSTTTTKPTTVQEVSSVGDCEDIPQPDLSANKHVEIIVPVVIGVAAFILIFLGILIIRRKSVLKIAKNSSCNTKISISDRKEEKPKKTGNTTYV